MKIVKEILILKLLLLSKSKQAAQTSSWIK